MKECVFCSNADIQTHMFLRTDLVIAFPTNIPITPGHVLICPTRHVSTVSELTDEEWAALRTALQNVQVAATQSFGAEGFNVAWNQGSMSGQSVPHLHIHVVPRVTGDTGVYQYEPRQFLYRPGSREESAEAELQAVAEQYQMALTMVAI